MTSTTRLAPSLTATGCVAFLLLLPPEASAQQPAQPKEAEASSTSEPSGIHVPQPITVEHDRLHEELARALDAGGKTGEAAALVHERLSGHFEEENRLVMPLLGLLEPMAQGGVTPAMRPAIEQSARVEEKLPRFLEEHRGIEEAVDRLEAAAEAEGKGDVARFARSLRTHAHHEEAILYPAAILVGEHVKTKLGEGR